MSMFFSSWVVMHCRQCKPAIELVTFPDKSIMAICMWNQARVMRVLHNENKETFIDHWRCINDAKSTVISPSLLGYSLKYSAHFSGHLNIEWASILKVDNSSCWCVTYDILRSIGEIKSLYIKAYTWQIHDRYWYNSSHKNWRISCGYSVPTPGSHRPYPGKYNYTVMGNICWIQDEKLP